VVFRLSCGAGKLGLPTKRATMLPALRPWGCIGRIAPGAGGGRAGEVKEYKKQGPQAGLRRSRNAQPSGGSAELYVVEDLEMRPHEVKCGQIADSLTIVKRAGCRKHP
jgi:hypothetical protein